MTRPASPARHPAPFARFVREVLTIALGITALFAARSSLADHYVVPSSSMEHALQPGDRVVVDKLAYGLRVPFTLERVIDGERPRRGDVVVFDSPEDGTRLIKRVVAIGGDTVEVRRGRVHIDGHALETVPGSMNEHFDSADVMLNLAYGGGPDFGPVRVPDESVLVLGDFRGNSRDGRLFGFVPERELYGRARRVYWRSEEGFTWRTL